MDEMAQFGAARAEIGKHGGFWVDAGARILAGNDGVAHAYTSFMAILIKPHPRRATKDRTRLYGSGFPKKRLHHFYRGPGPGGATPYKA